MLTRLAAALVLIPLVAACGGSSASPSSSSSPAASGSARPGTSVAVSAPPGSSASADATAAPSASAAAAAQLIGCEPTGPSFPVTALEGETGAEQADNPAAAALRAFLASPDGSQLPANDWREFDRTAKSVLFGQDDPSGEDGLYVTATAQLNGSAWEVPDSGQCRPRTWYANSYGLAADWRLGSKVSKTTTSFRALVTEYACAGGKSAAGRIGKPRIVYEKAKITITIGVKPLEGNQDCPGNPATPLTVKLESALGSRKLFDGGPYPAVEVKQP